MHLEAILKQFIHDPLEAMPNQLLCLLVIGLLIQRHFLFIRRILNLKSFLLRHPSQREILLLLLLFNCLLLRGIQSLLISGLKREVLVKGDGGVSVESINFLHIFWGKNK